MGLLVEYTHMCRAWDDISFTRRRRGWKGGNQLRADSEPDTLWAEMWSGHGHRGGKILSEVGEPRNRLSCNGHERGVVEFSQVNSPGPLCSGLV